MSGIALAFDVGDASAAVGIMLDRMAGAGEMRSLVALGPGAAIGGAWHAATPGGRAPKRREPELVVAVDGEIYTANGLDPDPCARIAEAYRASALERIEWLNGTFAAIIVDLAKRSVTVVADRLSSRPIYLWADGTRLIVASRMLAVAANAAVPKRLSRRAVVELLSHQRCFGATTLYADIIGLRAGEAVEWSGGVIRRRFLRKLSWQPAPIAGDIYEEQFRAALTGAVRRRTADAARHGLLMSGGLDSRAVLAAAAAIGRDLVSVCICPWRSPEVEIAERAVRVVGGKFLHLTSRAEDVSAHYDKAVDAVDGLLPGAMAFFSLRDQLKSDSDVLLNGHFLDVLFRGTYLPKQKMPFGIDASLPRLRPIADGSPRTLIKEHHVSTEREAQALLVIQGQDHFWNDTLCEGIESALAGTEFTDPYDAFDAFFLHAQSRHFSNWDNLSLTQNLEFRTPALDGELIDLYFSLPTNLRVAKSPTLRAMRGLVPKLWDVPDANTNERASLPFGVQLTKLITKAALRRLGLRRRKNSPSSTMSLGSWFDYDELFRRDAGLRGRIEAMSISTRLINTGVISGNGLAQIVERHLSGRASYKKMIIQLMTLDSWLARHPVEAIV